MFDVNLNIRGTHGDQSYSFIFPDQSQQFVLNVVKTINIFLSEDDDDKHSNQNYCDLYSSFSKFAKIFPVENVKWVPPSNIFSQFGELIDSLANEAKPKTESHFKVKDEPEESDKDDDSDHMEEELWQIPPYATAPVELKMSKKKSKKSRKSKQSLSTHLYGQHISDVVTDTENQLELVTGTREGAICMIVNKKQRFGMKDTSRYPFIKWDCLKRKDDGCPAAFSTHIVNFEEVDMLCDGLEKREKAKSIQAVHKLMTYKNINNHSEHLKLPKIPKSEKVPTGLKPVPTGTGPKQYSCEHCGKLFKETHSLKVHVEEVHELDPLAKNHICSQCGKGFASARRLNYHMKFTHSVKRNVEATCKICEKTFSRSKLKYHMLQEHENNLPFVCHSCGKGFVYECDLKAHTLTHTGEKPYVCDLCGKGFKEKGILLRHKFIHQSEKDHSCEVCLKDFRFKHDLVRHMRLHTGEKPHMCTWCGQSFSQAANMRKHIRKQHTMEKSQAGKQYGKGLEAQTGRFYPDLVKPSYPHNADPLTPEREPASNLQTATNFQYPANHHIETSNDIQQHAANLKMKKEPEKEHDSYFQTNSNIQYHPPNLHLPTPTDIQHAANLHLKMMAARKMTSMEPN